MKNILDEALPDHSNDPANYVLSRSNADPDFYGIYYKPANTLIVFRDDLELHYKLQDYLLSQNLEIVEGGMPGLQAKYGKQSAQEEDNSS